MSVTCQLRCRYISLEIVHLTIYMSFTCHLHVIYRAILPVEDKALYMKLAALSV